VKAVITSEFRFHQTPDGRVWTPTSFPNDYWLRYLDGFDSVTIMARVRDEALIQKGWKRVDSEGVECLALPDYRGAFGYARKRADLTRRIAGGLARDAAIILRVPSPIAGVVSALARRRGQPFGLEVVGDPWDVFAPGAIRHPLRVVLRRSFSRQLRFQCRQAAATAYVTREALQRRYPPREGAFTTHYSSIRLVDEDFAGSTGFRSIGQGEGQVVSIGSMAQMYKGFDTLMEAVRRCRERGVQLTLHLVGDGACRVNLQRIAAKLGLASAVVFHGQLPAGESIRRVLDGMDLFVLASRPEGLPRSMIEAMARGLPCIGTNVGGIPELVTRDCLVPPNDPAVLADRICQLLGDPGLRDRLGRENRTRAREYHEDVLRERRRAFYRAVRAATEAWRVGRLPE
jgi:glycosyltransferase involved in cell wall biosynthesis